MDRNALRILEDIQKSRLLDSAALRSMQEVAAKFDFRHLNAFRFQQAGHWKRVDELNRTFSRFDLQRIQSQAMESIKIFESIDKKILADVQRSVELMQPSWSHIQSVFNSPAFAAITESSLRLQTWQKSFLFDIAEKVRGFAEEIEEEAQELTITEIKESLIEKAKQLPNGTISFEGMIQIIIGLIALFYAIIAYHGNNEAAEQAHQDITALTKLIEKLPEEVIPKLAPLMQGQQDTAWFVVERQSNLYSKPFTKSSLIGTLYPNQRIQLIQRKHKWIYVQYFDYLDGIPRNGWVQKKYTMSAPK